MKAFHGKLAVKAEYLHRVSLHEKADEIIKGTYWEDGKGCAVGCTVHSNQHGSYEIELGIPYQLAVLEDHMFENMPNVNAKTWPRRFLEVIPVGADLSRVVNQFNHYVLLDPKWASLRSPTRRSSR